MLAKWLLAIAILSYITLTCRPLFSTSTVKYISEIRSKIDDFLNISMDEQNTEATISAIDSKSGASESSHYIFFAGTRKKKGYLARKPPRSTA